MKFSKIILISDTHMRLSEDVQKAVCGDYSDEQIYERQFFTNDEAIVNDFLSQKDSLDKQKPDLIIHGGDVGYQEIIDILESIAPVKVVNGNCDFQSFRTIEGKSKDYEYFDFEGIKISLAHSPYDLDFGDDNREINMHVHGHTHESYITQLGENEIKICPGSATMGRYGTPNSIACVYIADKKLISAELIEV